MRISVPTTLHSRLSLLSIVALGGLVVFAAIVLAANPFSVSTSSGVSGQSQPQQSSGGSTGQGSLLTVTPPSQGSHFGGSGGYHSHHSRGNSTA